VAGGILEDVRSTIAMGVVLGACVYACSSFGEDDDPGTVPAGDAGVVTEASADAPPGADAGATSPSAYASAVLADKPTIYWRLGDFAAPPGTVKDWSGNGRDGTGSATGIFAEPSLVGGDPDGALRLTAGTSLERPSDADLSFAGQAPFSLECWVKIGSSTVNGAPLVARSANGGGQPHGYALYLEGSRPFIGRYEGDGIGVSHSSPSALAPDVPHHVVGLYDGKALRLYVDGVDQAFSNTAVALKDHAVSFTVGKLSDNTGALVGTIDEVALYSYALPYARIAEHHRIGALE